MYYILYLLAGVLTVNGIPHFIKGVTGESHRTPFDKSSSAVTNVLWGSLNLVAAWVLWHYAGLHRDLAHTVRYEVVFGVAGLIMAVTLANRWSKDTTKSHK